MCKAAFSQARPTIICMCFVKLVSVTLSSRYSYQRKGFIGGFLESYISDSVLLFSWISILTAFMNN